MRIDSINYFNQHRNITHKKARADNIAVISSGVEDVSAKRDARIIDYLDKAEKREKQAAFVVPLTMLATVPLFYFIYKKAGLIGTKKTTLKDLTSGFSSLKDNNNIPTLDTCKSISGKLRDFLQKQVTYATATPEEIKRLGCPKPVKSMLLYGPPGTGKTFFAKIYAKTLGAEYMEVKYSDLNHKYVGQHLDNIKNVFDDVIKIANENKDKKYVLTFNEIDAIIVPLQHLRGEGGHSSFKKEERNVFLNYLDEVSEKAPNVTIIGTTNGTAKINSLDSAATSRFGDKISVDYPDRECLFEALKAHFIDEEGGNFIKVNDSKLYDLAGDLHKRKFSFRDLDYMANDAKAYRLHNYKENNDATLKFEYLEKAKNARTVTDGEAAA